MTQAFDIGDRVIVDGEAGEIVGWTGRTPDVPYLFDIQFDNGELVDDIDPERIEKE